jgi:capsular polysaccharide biosynthesis protein
MDALDQEITMNLSDIIQVIKKRFILITIFTLLCAVACGVISNYYVKPKYEAKLSMVIGRVPNKLQQSSMDYNDIMMFQNLVKTYAQIAKSRTVAQEAIKGLNLGGTITVNKLLSQISVAPQESTQLLDFSVRDNEAQLAMDKVNSVATAFIKEIKDVFPDGNVKVIDPAVLPQSPVSPNIVLNVAIAFVFGLILAMAAALLVEYMDKTVRNEDMVEKYIQTPVIGMIPKGARNMAR